MDSNTIEFFVKMKDMMSGGLANIAKNSQSAFGKVVQNMKQVREGSQFLNNSVEQLKARLKEVNQIRFGTVLKSEFQTATREAKTLENQIGRLTGRRGGLLGGGLRAAASAFLPIMGTAGLVLGGARFAKGAVNSAMQYELKDKMFQSLTGSRTGGEALTSNLFQLQQTPGFGKDVYNNAQMMLGYGVGQNQIIPVLKEIGAVTMGNTLRAKEMTLAYSQTIAAGKLIGKDLRQFVASGFNPLQVISEHWKEFGLTTHKTIGDLQEDLKKGKITADMVQKAFDIATSAGGRFGGSLAAIADTTQGKMQALQGQWEAFKITAGKTLMPLANGLLDFGKNILDTIGYNNKLSDSYRGQKAEVDSLVGTIMSLNQGNSERTALIDKLFAKYPDLFNNLNSETLSNNDLADALKRVNDQYDKLIASASNHEVADAMRKSVDAALSDIGKYGGLLQLVKAGQYDAVNQQMSWGDWLHMFNAHPFQTMFGGDKGWEKALQSEYNAAQAGYKTKKRASDAAAFNVDYQNATDGFMNLSNIFNNPKVLSNSVDKKNMHAFKTYYMWLASHNGSNDAVTQHTYPQIYKLANDLIKNNGAATGIHPSDNNNGTGSKTADGITGGGPRVININGVKFADKIEIVHGEFKLGEAELEARLHDMFLRVLSSGASIQG